MTRYAKRTDNTHAAIRDALRGVGWLVTDYSAVGNGIPDMRVTKDEIGLWVDAKSKGGEIERSQVKFAALHPECVFVAAVTPEYAIQMCHRVWAGREVMRGMWHCEDGVRIED
jgi:hypothetical protein